VSIEAAVQERYANAAQQKEESLCCAVEYDARYLEAIPDEIIERDYGCGDPSQHLRPGETVLDLGSGTGKICFIASQVVGPKGKVIGVDMTDDMLALARRAAEKVSSRIGYANVQFRKGRIQDLALDLEELDAELKGNVIDGLEGYLSAEKAAARLRSSSPMISDETIDVTVSNCVLNLVDPADKQRMFTELFRVLKTGGRAVISDIVSSDNVPTFLQDDPNLWSGCVSGAMREDKFIRAFADAGFEPVRILARDAEPWQTVKGIEFRSLTLEAIKGGNQNSVAKIFMPKQNVGRNSCC
tara:strand:- start:577 stop:1473 length:897 start_codon:yes stop_codon:yes gene_type:complete